MATKKTPLLQMLDKTLLTEIEKAANEHCFSEDEVAALIERCFSLGQEELLADFKASAPDHLAAMRADDDSFRARCYDRWREPMDLLRMLWITAQEIGEAHAHEGPNGSDPLVFDTLAHLHPKALLITSEIMCLLEGGFADGALARWRSLHETVVTAMFIAKHGHEVARDYRSSIWFENHKAAVALNSVAERANMQPFTDEAFAEIEAMRDKAEVHIGRRLNGEWDWASSVFAHDRIKFIDIERNIGLDHWRPRYKWASQHVHSCFRHPGALLGMVEAEEVVFQIGPSNSGFIDPLHMTAVSLSQMTAAFLLHGDPNLDRLIYVKIIQTLASDIGEAAVRAEKESLEKHRAQSGAGTMTSEKGNPEQ
ncbi:DUF5677 domain-containing protein [Roseinatronobacter monicus]|uniref:Uncharacterized protein n=1 Tax=Roseinatronobacter monicus TaxID=393481 RepID=A0A543K4Z8_9RHOB|nr:DUF5677 domain-containing protein [Roseinatronobacter monicus]TQM90152.1 hypothetical protein BD293_4077 [Roseinatronobacter monicus]